MAKKTLLISSLTLAVLFLAGCGQKQDAQTEMKANTAPVVQEQAQPMDDTGASQAGYMDVSPQEAKKMIDENPDLIVVDVSPNYANGHLPRAVNYYVGDGSLDKAIPSLDKNATYLVYCHVDSASILGSQKLVDAGFKNVYRLEGNYKAWIDAGYPIEK